MSGASHKDVIAVRDVLDSGNFSAIHSKFQLSFYVHSAMNLSCSDSHVGVISSRSTHSTEILVEIGFQQAGVTYRPDRTPTVDLAYCPGQRHLHHFPMQTCKMSTHLY